MLVSGGQATVSGTQQGGAEASWQAIRADPSIQYGPVEFPKPPAEKPPEWLEALGRWLKSVFDPIGQSLGMSWPVLSKVLLAIAVACVLLLAWRLLAPWLEGLQTGNKPADEPDWAPPQAAAMALLEDADRLAAEGRFDEATHLLLTRSVAQIAAVRPGWVNPASTAREIAGHTGLPGKARAAFGVIAGRVERSLFALVPLDAADWQAARGAYADFALDARAFRQAGEPAS